ncbi:hypothetical protein CLV91_1785 [Maribacter vaceletii]|uniref:Uncharacterized protein n=1 Tax=Maribacter vaceletii TaxID=1206816 RepID=A0A495E8T4_9FLAO|nr:hypothetical protein CLV91_1785 [Maribacter vaceletii]
MVSTITVFINTIIMYLTSKGIAGNAIQLLKL